MLTEQIRIKRIEDNALVLETRRSSQCGACSLKQGCGHHLMDHFLRGHQNELSTRIGIDYPAASFREGDTVLLTMEEGVLLKASAILYGLPLAGLLGAVLLAGMFSSHELTLLAGAFAGLAAGLLVARALSPVVVAGGLSVSPLPEVDRVGDQPIVDKDLARPKALN